MIHEPHSRLNVSPLALPVDESSVQHVDQWVYMGEGKGSYSQTASMEFMGAGPVKAGIVEITNPRLFGKSLNLFRRATDLSHFLQKT